MYDLERSIDSDSTIYHLNDILSEFNLSNFVGSGRDGIVFCINKNVFKIFFSNCSTTLARQILTFLEINQLANKFSTKVLNKAGDLKSRDLVRILDRHRQLSQTTNTLNHNIKIVPIKGILMEDENPLGICMPFLEGRNISVSSLSTQLREEVALLSKTSGIEIDNIGRNVIQTPDNNIYLIDIT